MKGIKEERIRYFWSVIFANLAIVTFVAIYAFWRVIDDPYARYISMVLNLFFTILFIVKAKKLT